MFWIIGKLLFFLVNLFPVVVFGAGAYLGFSGKRELGFWTSSAFLLTALFFLYMAIRNYSKTKGPFTKGKIKDLKMHGRRMITTFKALDRRWNVRVNGQSPIVIYCQGANGRVYQSEDLWFSGDDSSSYGDPRFRTWQTLQAAEHSKKYLIPVYINPAKEDEYFLDISDLQIK